MNHTTFVFFGPVTMVTRIQIHINKNHQFRIKRIQCNEVIVCEYQI